MKELTGLSRSSIYLLITKGNFPKQINLCGGQSVAWVEAEIEGWIKSRINNSHTHICLIYEK